MMLMQQIVTIQLNLWLYISVFVLILPNNTIHDIHLSFLSGKAIIESITLKPLDYYVKELDKPKRPLSTYCLSYLNDLDWNDVPTHTFAIVLDVWVIYKENPTDIDIGSGVIKLVERTFRCCRYMFSIHI